MHPSETHLCALAHEIENVIEVTEPEQISILQETDWNEEWKRLQRVRRKADDAQYWNKRSKNFDSAQAPNPYAWEFLEHAGIRDGERVLDMGCGTGTLAVPLALRRCHVIAADFSEGMLEQAQMRAQAADVDIETLHLAWADDWEAAGLTANSVDVAIASRSIATLDMKDALLKLTNVARRICCITLPVGCTPRMDPRVLKACGVDNTHGSDYQYAWNILFNEGFHPSASYINSERRDTFNTMEEAFEDFDRMLRDVIAPERTDDLEAARVKLRQWLRDNIVENERAGELDAKGRPEGILRLRELRIVTWGFISWSPDR